MQTAVVVLLDGLAYGMVLFIISVGLSVTMGLMRVVNLAHGALPMAGGYVAAVLVGAGTPFFAALVVGTVAAGLLGGLSEITIFRPLYRKGELAQVLMTFGMVFVTIAGLTFFFGTDIRRSQSGNYPKHLQRSKLLPSPSPMFALPCKHEGPCKGQEGCGLPRVV